MPALGEGRSCYGPTAVSTLFHLIGFPGTGKYTIAQAMRNRLEAAERPGRVVDNHYVNNVIFGLLELGAGVPEEAWALCGEVWNPVLQTVETLSPPAWWFIVTNYLVEGKGDREWMDRVAAVARRRGSDYVPVRLICAREELMRRVTGPARRDRRKITDPAVLERLLDTTPLLTPAGPHTLTLDVTHLSADAAAERILVHAAQASEAEA
jgi:hypothetical protein